MPAGSVSVDVRGNYLPFEAGWRATATRLFSHFVVPVGANTDEFIAKITGASSLANERLGSINTRSAQREMRQLGDVAEQQMRRMRTSQMALVGGAASVFGGVRVLRGLNESVQAVAELNDTVGFSQQVFGLAGREIEEFASGAADALGQSKQQATAAATSFAVFGKQAGLGGDALVRYSTELVKLASDMKAAKGGSIDEALTALGSGLAGTSTEPLRNYGITITELMVKEEARRRGLIEDTRGVLPQNIRALATQSLIMRQAGDILGQYAREHDSLPARQERLRANLANLKTEVGEGALPAFEALASGGERLLGVFNQLPDGVQGFAGMGAAVVGLGAVAGGALTSIAGGLGVLQSGMSRLRGDTSSDLAAIGDAAEDMATRSRASFGALGTAAKAAGRVVAAAGISAAIFEIGNEISGMGQRSTDALNRFQAGLRGSAGEVAKSFADLVQVEDDTLKLSHVWTTFGERFRLAGAQSVESAADMHAAFSRVFALGPDAAQELIDSLRKQNDAVNHNSDDYRKSEKILDEWQASVDAAKDAQGSQTSATHAQTDALGDLGGALEETIGKFEELATKARTAVEPMFGALSATMSVEDARIAVADKQQALEDILNYNTQGIRSAREQLADARAALAEAKKDVGPWSEAADRARKEAQSAEDRLLEIRREMAKELYDKQQRDAKIARGEVDDLGPAVFAQDWTERLAVAQRDVARARGEVARISAGQSDQVASATERVAEAERRLAEERAKAGPASRDAADAQRDLHRAQLDALKAAADEKVELARLRDEIEKHPDMLADSGKAIDEWAARVGLGADAVARLKDELALAALAAQGLADPPEAPKMEVPFFGPEARGRHIRERAAPIAASNRSSADPGIRRDQAVLDAIARGDRAGADRLRKMSLEEFEKFERFIGGLTPRAMGGPIEMDRDYLVGEKQPEVLRLTRSGAEIIPSVPQALATRATSPSPTPAAAGSTGGPGLEVIAGKLDSIARLLGEARLDVTINTLDPRQAADEVVRAQRERGWEIMAGTP